MVQVIRENRPKSTAERFGNAFSGAAHSLSKDIPEHTMRQRKDEQQRRAIQELMGEDLSNLPEDLQKLYYENFINQQSSNKKFSHEKELQSSKFGHEKDLALLENEEKIKRLIGQENEKNSELQRKTDEKLVPLRSGLQTLQRMRQL
jgi:hypothetical protein